MRINGQEITVVGGDSEDFLCGVYDKNKQLLPLINGDIVIFSLKERLSSDVTLFTKTITVFTEGKAIINIAPADTDNLVPKTYYYSVKYIRTDGTTKTVIHNKKFIIE